MAIITNINLSDQINVVHETKLRSDLQECMVTLEYRLVITRNRNNSRLQFYDRIFTLTVTQQYQIIIQTLFLLVTINTRFNVTLTQKPLKCKLKFSI